MIKYIGSKRVLVPAIVDLVRSLPGAASVFDVFSGTSRVGHAMKRAGFRVHSNDYLTFAHALAVCYVQADREVVGDDAERLVKELSRIPGDPGYFTSTFCEQSRFFQPKNGARVDAIRNAIAKKGLPPELEAIALVSLMEAADRVDSTTGLQMAYLKAWAPRAFNDLELRMPDVLRRAPHGKGSASCADAAEAVERVEADVAYIDPPYNQHSYLGNYHIWETLARWDAPEPYGIACKRIDCRTRKSAFNFKSGAYEALRRVIEGVQARYIIVSFNNEGYIARAEMELLLQQRGRVHVVSHDFKRYVGAQIGIYNLQGQVVGEVSHLRNTEYIYVVVPHDVAWEPTPSEAQQGLFAKR